jgi:hypothetical protein
MHTRYVLVFVVAVSLELGYFLIVIAAWPLPHIGESIASATGTANIGIGIQMMFLFPLWAPVLTVWVRNRIEGQQSDIGCKNFEHMQTPAQNTEKVSAEKRG